MTPDHARFTALAVILGITYLAAVIGAIIERKRNK